MISASSSSTFRAARKLIAEPLVCLEHHRTWAASLGQQQRRSYNTERPASAEPRRRPPQPVPSTARFRPRSDRLPQNSKVKVDPSNGTPERPKRLLEPYVLSKRLVGLVSQGQLNKAVDMLQNSPLDASNVKTWNTMLLHCMMEKRFKTGYRLFTDMKRRGFRPNVRTYNVLLSGLSRIEDWKGYKVQFENTRAIWRSFIQHVESLKKIDPKHSEICSNPAAFYILILAANNDYNSIFDVLNDLDEEGPFSPTEFIYSKIFRSLAYRKQLVPGDEENVAYRSASDAKLLWKDLGKRAAKDPELVSDHVISYFIRVLTKGRPADQLYAFDVIRDYLGLSKPGEETPPRRVEVTSTVLDAALKLCIATQKYRLCIHYVQQTIDEAVANNRKAIVDPAHMEKVLQSYAAMTTTGLAGESDRAVETIEWMHRYHALGWDVKPLGSTYWWALMSCWRSGDWASAARIAELMTGCHAEDFADGSKTSTPQLDDRSRDRMIVPDARAMSCLLRAALASGDVASMRQCVRMATFFGGMRFSTGTKFMDVYLAQRRPSDDIPKSAVAKQEELFYSTKVASALAKILKRVLEGADPAEDTPEMKMWRGLKARATRALRESTKPGVETPDYELEPLGSSGGLEATDRFVDYDLATRSQNTGRATRR